MNKLNIYVASSWKNSIYSKVVGELRTTNANIYDFRNPEPGNNGFSWSNVDPNWKLWNTEEYKRALNHPLSERGFDYDMKALKNADMTILVLPCGRSAHLELGFAVGCKQKTAILLDQNYEPELMYKMIDLITTDINELKDFIFNCKK